MNAAKSFYEFNLGSPQERQERNTLFPELAKFHIALREELTEDEYLDFFNAERECLMQFAAQAQSAPRN